MANIIALTRGYQNEDAIDNVIDYMAGSVFGRDELTQQANIYTFNQGTIINMFKSVQKANLSEAGKRICHIVIGFGKLEIDEPGIVEVMKIAIDYFQNEYLVFGAVHEGSQARMDEYLHIHLAVNTVSHIDGRRLYDSNEEYYKFVRYMIEKCPYLLWSLERKDVGLIVNQ